MQANLASRRAPRAPLRRARDVGPERVRLGQGLGLYRSDDSGATWTSVTEDPRPLMRIGGGDLPMLAVDPKNADVVYSASIVTVRSSDGGKTWTSLRGAPGGDDYQNVWIDPSDSNVILLASDQGAVVQRTAAAPGAPGTTSRRRSSTTCRRPTTFPYRVCSGQQESGSVCISSRGDDGASRSATGIRWAPSSTATSRPTRSIRTSSTARGATRSRSTAGPPGRCRTSRRFPSLGSDDRVDRTKPLMFSPVDPHTLYYGANVIYSTTRRGRAWNTISPDLARAHPGVPAEPGSLADKDPKADRQRGVVYALAPSFKSTDTLWAGTDDGLIQVTRDGGKAWHDVTPPALTPWSKVTQIAASHFDDDYGVRRRQPVAHRRPQPLHLSHPRRRGARGS